MTLARPVFIPSNDIYTPDQIETVISLVWDDLSFVRKNKKTTYVNCACAFDIETSSFYEGVEKRAIMYVWTFAINGIVIMGRTWEEYQRMITVIQKRFRLNNERRLLVYVHNLPYDWQFLRLWFRFTRVFSKDRYKPLYAIDTNGIEYRCSYQLSGYSLDTLAKNLKHYTIQKMIGDLDYSLIRHSTTPLTDKEKGYCANDVKIICAYIIEEIERNNGIQNIPLTKTGYVRIHCRNACLGNGRNMYSSLMRELTMEPLEYKFAREAFAGGFTHTNAIHARKVMNNTESDDFISCYPAEIVLNGGFPMGKGEWITVTTESEFDEVIKYYACIFECRITGVKPKFKHENYISKDKCLIKRGVIANNGRVAYADEITLIITEVDYKIIREVYSWDTFEIGRCIRYKRDYLPTAFVRAVLELYEKKTTLKGVKGMEEEYMNAKELLNGCYGMSVTDPVKDEWIYNDGWLDKPKPADLEEALNRYNRNYNRFQFYIWGIYVTAFSRYNLWSAILELKEDYIYSDTDSVKYINRDKHIQYFRTYNEMQLRKIEIASKVHGIPKSAFMPKTRNGITKVIGAWENDGHYRRFKALGAKRYMIQHYDGSIEITVSGLNKRVSMPYIIDHYSKRLRHLHPSIHEPHLIERANYKAIFRAFDDDLYIPPDKTGKRTHTYIDEEIRGFVRDYRGVIGQYHEYSFVHLEGADYSLSLAQEYLDFITRRKSEESFSD